MKTFISRALVLLLIATAPAVVMAQKEVKKTFSGVKSVRVKTSSGSCKLLKSTSGTVDVTLRYDFSDDVYKPSFEQSGDKLVLGETFTSHSVSGSSPFWTIAIPDGISVRFTTGSGDIIASDVKGNLDATTGSGDLEFRKFDGTINATTGSGDLDLDGFVGEVDIKIGSGSARIAGSRGDLSVSCGSGNIRIADSQAEFKANTGSGDVEGRNVTITASSRFNSGSGDASISLAAAPRFDLAVNSGSGDAELNFNGNEIAGEIVMTANKSHGKIIAPFEFDKTEEVPAWRDEVTVKKTAVKGNSSVKINIGTGSGEAVLKK